MTRQITSSLCLGMALAALVTAPSAWGGKLYKWVDQAGNVTYQDQPPPEDAQGVEEYRDPEAPRVATSAAAQRAPVTLYAIEKCDACDLVRLFLQKRAVPFSEIDVSKDRDAQQELLDTAGQLGVPTLMVGNTPLAGYNPTGIEAELRNAGYLPPLENEDTAEEPAFEEAPETQNAEVEDGENEPPEVVAEPADTTAGNF